MCIIYPTSSSRSEDKNTFFGHHPVLSIKKIAKGIKVGMIEFNIQGHFSPKRRGALDYKKKYISYKTIKFDC